MGVKACRKVWLFLGKAFLFVFVLIYWSRVFTELVMGTRSMLLFGLDCGRMISGSIKIVPIRINIIIGFQWKRYLQIVSVPLNKLNNFNLESATWGLMVIKILWKHCQHDITFIFSMNVIGPAPWYISLLVRLNNMSVEGSYYLAMGYSVSHSLPGSFVALRL